MTQPWESERLRWYACGHGIDMGCGRNKIGDFGVDVAHDSYADLVSDMARVALPDSSQDYIVACHSLEHCPDTVAVLKEWFRLLRSGGTVAVWVPNGEKKLPGILGDSTGTHLQLFTPTTLPKFFRYCGFAVDETSTRLNSLFVRAHKP